MRLRTMTTAVAALAVLAAGCSSEDIAERVAEEAAEQLGDGQGEVNLDLDEEGGNISVETSEGSISMGSGGELPASFPADLPLPEGDYQVASSFEQSGASEDMQLQTALLTPVAFEDTVAYFEQALPDAGWEITDQQRTEMGEIVGVTIIADNGDTGAMLMIGESNDGMTMVNYGIGATIGQ